jgi:hypothetical protein
VALRFLGEETEIVPRERLLSAMRLLLDNQQIADQVIPDLSRWEDWSVLDRLVTMFKSSEKGGYIRQPVVAYLIVAAEQEGLVGTQAQAALVDLERVDPETVKRARSSMAFSMLARARSDNSATAGTPPADAGAAAEVGLPDANVAANSNEPARSAAEQAFAASAADIAAANSKDPSAIPPDPARFGQQAPSNPPPDGGAVKVEAAGAEGRNLAAADQANAAEVPAAGAAPSPTVSALLVVGLPLAAVAVLVGVFWWILRGGGV